MDLPPRTNYAACRKCGSEYMVSRRGGAYALQPVTPEEFVLTQQMAAVEHEREMGCANIALSILAGVTILFCLIGGLGQILFNNRAICFGSGLLAVALVGVGAVVMLRNLERDRRREARLLGTAGLAHATSDGEPTVPPAPTP